MTGWNGTTLGEIADINPSAISSAGSDRLIRYVDISSVDIGFLNSAPATMFLKDAPSRARRLVQFGDSVLSTVRPNRKSRFFVRQDLADVVVSTGFAVLHPKSGKADARYLYSVICNEDFVSYLVANEKGAAYPAVTTDIIERYPLVLPPLPEQKAIAAVLGALDDKIELNRRMNATLEAMARALFKSWFVDFDPVRAKMEGKQPFGMDAATAALFPDRLTADGLPEGWTVDEIGNAVTAVGGSTPSTEKPEYWSDGCHAWATPKDLSALKSPVLLSTERKITNAGIAVISSGLLPAGTVLMSSRAPIGYIAVTEVPVAVNQGFIAMVCDKRLPNLYVWMWAHHNLDNIKNHANGSTFQEISKGSFRPLPCIVPAQSILDNFQKVASSLWDKIVANEKERRNLEMQRDYLLPKLISGDIRIPDAEKFVEAA